MHQITGGPVASVMSALVPFYEVNLGWDYLWIRALIGIIFLVLSVLGFFILLTEDSEDASGWDKVFGTVGCIFVATIGVLIILPPAVVLTDRFGVTTDVVGRLTSYVEAVNRAAPELAPTKWAITSLGIFNALAAAFLACSILRENLRSVQGWILLLAIPFGCLLAFPVLGPTLGIALPDNPVIHWVAKSIAQPTGILTFAVLAETYWISVTFARHVAAVYIGPITFTLILIAWICFWFGTFGDIYLVVKVLLFGVFVILALTMKGSQQAESDVEQSERNERAEQIKNAVLNESGYSTSSKFSLYLIPFDAADTVDARSPTPGITESVDFEMVLEKAVMPSSQLLTLRAPGEAQTVRSANR